MEKERREWRRMNLHYMNQRLSSLVVFRELLQDPAVAAFQRMLASAAAKPSAVFQEMDSICPPTRWVATASAP